MMSHHMCEPNNKLEWLVVTLYMVTKYKTVYTIQEHNHSSLVQANPPGVELVILTSMSEIRAFTGAGGLQWKLSIPDALGSIFFLAIQRFSSMRD